MKKKLSNSQKKALKTLYWERTVDRARIHKSVLRRLKKAGLLVDMGDFVGLTEVGVLQAKQFLQKEKTEK